MRVVYIAGPFRAPTAWGIEQNVRAAEATAFRVASMGFAPLCPHANTRFFHGTLTDAFWLEATMELLRRCDAVMLSEGWDNSSGTKAEIREAERLGIPVFYQIASLVAWGRDAAPGNGVTQLQKGG